MHVNKQARHFNNERANVPTNHTLAGIDSEHQQESALDILNNLLKSFDNDYNSDKKNEPRTVTNTAAIGNKRGKRK